VQGEFCASLNWVCIWSTIYVYTTESSWNPNSETPEFDWPQRDRPAVCVITQQYSFSHLCLVALSFPWGKNWARVWKTLSVNFSQFLKIVTLKLRRLGSIYKTDWVLGMRLWPLGGSTVDEHRKHYKWKKYYRFFPVSALAHIACSELPLSTSSCGNGDIRLTNKFLLTYSLQSRLSRRHAIDWLHAPECFLRG
jgi:hypothetical protein